MAEGQENFSSAQPEHDESTIRPDDSMSEQLSPLTLDLKDSDLVNVINQRIEASNSFYHKKDIPNRRNKNKAYLFGQQIDEKQFKYYQARYVDNLIYEAENTIKPIALSRLPDLIAKPGNESDESKENAKVLTDVINDDIRKRENRKVLGLAFKHLPVYFVGAIKALWDPQMGNNGDYRFKVVHPENLVIDHTATTKSTGDMDFIAEASEISVKEATMMFPSKEEEIIKKVSAANTRFDKDKETDMASKIKIWEVWFTWYKSTIDDESGEKKWERIEGVVWKFQDIILKKMKNPYWDWTGKKRLFRYDITNGKKKKNYLTHEEIQSILAGGLEGMEQPFESEMVYKNFFTDPQKPYILIGYDEWGEMPLDETSRIEQILLLQDNVNKRGRQITEMNDRAKGKHVFSTESGLTKEDIENMDMDDPNEDVVVEGKVSETHGFIPGTPAPAGLYKEQEADRQKVFAKMGTHSTTRGERESQETATGRQILRESDFGRIDDIVEDTINAAAEQMSSWAMQFIKLFYKEEHMRKLEGKDGSLTFKAIKNDNVEDGMEVGVSASGVDKAQRKREAFERAKMKLTDPLTFFMDTDSSDPIGRTEKLMIFMSAPELYIQKYVKKRDTTDMINALNQSSPEGEGVGIGTAAQAFGAVPVVQPAPAAQPAQGGGGDPMAQPITYGNPMMVEFMRGYGGGGNNYATW